LEAKESKNTRQEREERMPKYLNYQDRTDGRTILPMLEFAYGSLQLSRKQALIEMGFPEDEVDNLMEMRAAEDLMQDPLMHRVMGEAVVKEYKKEID
jgi:hypothetical protein